MKGPFAVLVDEEEIGCDVFPCCEFFLWQRFFAAMSSDEFKEASLFHKKDGSAA